MSESGLVDIAGRLRSPAATPGHWAGLAPPNKGLRYRRTRRPLRRSSWSCAKPDPAATRTGRVG